MSQPAETANAYEEQRRQRVLHNKQRLEELGLLNNPLSGVAEAQERAAAARQQKRERAAAAAEATPPLEPSRRSRRQRGENVENEGMRLGEGPDGCSPARPAAPRPRPPVDLAALEGSADPSVNAHNLMRIRSMSEKALRTRIWRIQRADKLASFVACLDACGLAGLAGEARDALRQMCGERGAGE